MFKQKRCSCFLMACANAFSNGDSMIDYSLILCLPGILLQPAEILLGPRSKGDTGSKAKSLMKSKRGAVFPHSEHLQLLTAGRPV